MPRLLLLFLAFSLGGCSRQSAAPAPPATKPEIIVETVAYPSGKDTVHGILHHPSGTGSYPSVVVVHGDYGVTESVKEQARRLADHGYVVLAVDLYRGEPIGDLMEAHVMGRGLPDERVLDDLRAAADYLTRRSDVRGPGLGILGWDMGGGYALDAALRDARFRAVVVCYGRLTTDPQLLQSLNGSVLGIFAARDEGISPEIREQFRKAMSKANKRLAGMRVYPGCGHGFLNPTRDETAHAEENAARADAWRHIENYLDAELRP